MNSRKKLALVKPAFKPRSTPAPQPQMPPWKPWIRGSDVLTTWRGVVINRRTGERWRPPSEYRNDWYFRMNREASEE